MIALGCVSSRVSKGKGRAKLERGRTSAGSVWRSWVTPALSLSTEATVVSSLLLGMLSGLIERTWSLP